MNQSKVIPSITIPDGGYNGGPEGICVICARALIRDSRPFMWAACVTCRRFDRVVARELGGKVFLPLGLHSIMNGAAISVRAEAFVQQAQIDAVMAVARNWGSLFDYKRDLVKEMTADAGWEKLEAVPWTDWSAKFPSSFEESLTAYLRLINRNYKWLEAIIPRINEESWLSLKIDDETNY